MKKKIKLNKIQIFTDEWIGYLIYCSSDEGKKVAQQMFPDQEAIFENVRGLTFWNNKKVPLIWISSEQVKTNEQKLLTLIHESYHLVNYLADRISIKDEEWFGETLEFVVKQGMKILKIKCPK